MWRIYCAIIKLHYRYEVFHNIAWKCTGSLRSLTTDLERLVGCALMWNYLPYTDRRFSVADLFFHNYLEFKKLQHNRYAQTTLPLQTAKANQMLIQ